MKVFHNKKLVFALLLLPFLFLSAFNQQNFLNTEHELLSDLVKNQKPWETIEANSEQIGRAHV